MLRLLALCLGMVLLIGCDQKTSTASYVAIAEFRGDTKSEIFSKILHPASAEQMIDLFENVCMQRVGDADYATEVAERLGYRRLFSRSDGVDIYYKTDGMPMVQVGTVAIGDPVEKQQRCTVAARGNAKLRGALDEYAAGLPKSAGIRGSNDASFNRWSVRLPQAAIVFSLLKERNDYGSVVSIGIIPGKAKS